MPELPEVETVVRDLRPLLVGRRFRAVEVGKQKLRRAWKPSWNAKLIDAQVQAIRRRGKWILIDLESATLLVHLGMTGQLTFAELRSPVEDHTHLRFSLDSRTHELRFRDIRRFGSATLFESQNALEDFLNDRLGPEPFDIDPDYFRKQLKATKRNLKATLLDQKVIAGVGNIYADEACFLAGLHPGKRANTLTAVQSEKLREAIEMVIANAIAGRGSTIRNYVGGSGLKGNFQNEFNVYGRTGEPCPKCSAEIQVKFLGGRSSHFCKNCQRRSG